MSEKIPSISLKIDNESTGRSGRRSPQPAPDTGPGARRTSSIGKKRKLSQTPIKKPSVPDIPEAERSESDGEYVEPKIEKSENDVRISFMKRTSRQNSTRSNHSKISVQSSNAEQRTSVNYGCDQSNLSSLHGSVASLPVIREQYCCCQRWTRLERYLAIIVAILAVIIISLVIVIGFVANHGDRGVDSYWAYFKF